MRHLYYYFIHSDDFCIRQKAKKRVSGIFFRMISEIHYDVFQKIRTCFRKNITMLLRRIEISYKRMKQSSDYFDYFFNYQTFEALLLFSPFSDDFNILP